MSDPIYLHFAARSKSYGYTTEHGYSKKEMQRSLSRLLSIPANDILQSVPVPIDAIFVSNQLPGQDGSEELVVNQLADSLFLSDHHGKQYRLSGVSCSRVETATNGLAALKVAMDHIQSGSGDTVLVIGGEKITPSGFCEQYSKEEFDTWAGRMVEYIASALSPYDRTYCRSMPAAMGIILNYYARTRSIRYDDLKKLIEQLSIRAYENVRNNKNAFQRHLKIFSGKNTEEVYRDDAMNPMRVYPLRQLDMSPFNDGAGAILISRHRELEMLNDGKSRADVAITGCAIAQDRLALTERHSLDSFPATRLAARRAYAQAGLDLRDWQHNLAPLILEHHDAFVPLTLINLEDLMLFHNHWEVIKFLGEEYLGKKHCPLWLNPSGGLLEGHPFAGTAIIKMVECFARLTSKSEFAEWSTPGELEDKTPKTAIIQSFGGIGANVGVAVLDKCDEGTGETLRVRGNVSHYLNLGSHVVEEVGTSAGNMPSDGQIISLARVRMPFIHYEQWFKERFALTAQEPIEIVLALVQTLQGKVYALATRESNEAQLAPESLLDEDIFVRLDKINNFLSFSIKQRKRKSSFKFLKVA
jgi:acetyl-CoA acetyltransferase